MSMPLSETAPSKRGAGCTDQSIFAATFFFVWPVALVITIPFAWVHAFYHNVSIVGTGNRNNSNGFYNHNYGVYIDTGAVVSAVDGNLTISGTGSAGRL